VLDSGLLKMLTATTTAITKAITTTSFATNAPVSVARAVTVGSGGGSVLTCGGVPHAGQALANELICLPHLAHRIKAIEVPVLNRHRRRRFCVRITRFLRANIGFGRRAPVICSGLSPMIAAIRRRRNRRAAAYCLWLVVCLCGLSGITDAE
jgi:hypothetical protein